MAMFLDYKPMRYEGKGFLRNLNIRIHKDITGEMWFGGRVVIANRELLYQPPKTIQVKARKRNDKINTSIRIIGCSCLLNKLLDKSWGKD